MNRIARKILAKTGKIGEDNYNALITVSGIEIQDIKKIKVTDIIEYNAKLIRK
jgi:hypothetical protein